MDLAGACCIFILGIFCLIDAEAKEEWSYDGSNGPENWVKKYELCGRTRQSPIDFPDEEKMLHDTSLSPFKITGLDNPSNYQLELLNNGHSAKVNIKGDVFVEGGSLPGRFKMAQFHFHWGEQDDQGSEHLFDGESYPMELHIVTYNTKYRNIGTAMTKERDGLAVLGFWFESTGDVDNPLLTPLINRLASVQKANASNAVRFNGLNLNNVIKGNLDRFYRYSGSLTTPPCYESVIWSVFNRRIGVSKRQLNAFRSLRQPASNQIQAEALVDNYRPTQKLNGRKVSRSFTSASSIPSSSIALMAFLAFTANLIVSSRQ